MTEVPTVSPLHAYLSVAARRAFDWGICDCMTLIADWVAQVRGVDPMAELRRCYDSPASCHRLTRYFDDPVGVVEAQLGGLSRTDAPAPGDVAVIEAPGVTRDPVGAIWTGKSWACRAPEGLTTIRPAFVRILAAWSVGYAP